MRILMLAIVAAVLVVDIAWADSKPKLGGSREIVKAWVNFDGTNCIDGVGADECVIRDSYNVDRVVYDPVVQGGYFVFWKKPFKDCDLPIQCYVVVATAAGEHTRVDSPHTPESAIVKVLNSSHQNSTANLINVIAIGTLD